MYHIKEQDKKLVKYIYYLDYLKFLTFLIILEQVVELLDYRERNSRVLK